MAWLEDMIPWQYTDLLKKITDAVDIPILTGEDIYLKEAVHGAVPRTTRWISSIRTWRPPAAFWRPRRSATWREEYGVADGDALRRHAGLVHGERALRRGDRELSGAGEPLRGRAVVERSGEGVEKPIVNKGFITVPDKPGLASS